AGRHAVRSRRPGQPMSTPSLFKRIMSRVLVFDIWLLVVLVAIACVGLATMHSAVGGTGGRFAEQVRNFGVAFVIMWLAAQASPQVLIRVAVPVYLVGVVLLLGVELAGETRQGAT